MKAQHGTSGRGRIRVLIGSGIVLASALGLSAMAQQGHDHGGGGGGEGKEDGKGQGGHKGHGGMGGGHGGMHGGAAPGAVEPMCREPGDMPPHYCEPSYKVMSSVPGVKIAAVTPAGDKAVMVALAELNPMSSGVAQPLVLVGGTGDLAGALVIEGGWRQSHAVHLILQGTDSIYNRKSMHLHLFPLTAR